MKEFTTHTRPFEHIGGTETNDFWAEVGLTSILQVPLDNLLYKNFRRTDDQSRTLAVDGTGVGGGPFDFRVTAPARKIYIIYRVIFQITDQDIAYEHFAGLGLVLANGIGVTGHDSDDTELIDFMDGQPLDATREFAHLAGIDFKKTQSGIGQDPDVVAVRWSIFKAGAVPRLTPGQYLQLKVQDDLSDIVLFNAIVQGYQYDAPKSAVP